VLVRLACGVRRTPELGGRFVLASLACGVRRSVCVGAFGWWYLADSGVRRSICVGVLAGSWLQSPLRFFSLLIYFVNTFYKSYAFSAICRDNAAAITCIAVQHKKLRACQLRRVLRVCC
jgi:hypothetical protein